MRITASKCKKNSGAQGLICSRHGHEVDTKSTMTFVLLRFAKAASTSGIHGSAGGGYSAYHGQAARDGELVRGVHCSAVDILERVHTSVTDLIAEHDADVQHNPGPKGHAISSEHE
jgi:hypothetical protein